MNVLIASNTGEIIFLTPFHMFDAVSFICSPCALQNAFIAFITLCIKLRIPLTIGLIILAIPCHIGAVFSLIVSQFLYTKIPAVTNAPSAIIVIPIGDVKAENAIFVAVITLLKFENTLITLPNAHDR